MFSFLHEGRDLGAGTGAQGILQAVAERLESEKIALEDGTLIQRLVREVARTIRSLKSGGGGE